MTDTDLSGTGEYVSGESEGFSVTSNGGETSEEMEANLATPDDEGDKVSKAAKELGKRGGKASAERRAKGDGGSSDASEPAVDGVDGDGGEAEPEKPLGKPRNDPKARMLEATRKEAEAKKERDAVKAERDQIRAENDRLRREFEAMRPAPVQPEARIAKDEDPEPKQEDYDDWNAYMRDMAKHAGRQEVKRYQAEAQKEQWISQKADSIAMAAKQDMDSFSAACEKAKAADPAALDGIPEKLWDFLQPSWEAEPGQIHQGHVMADEIMKLDHPVEVLKHLGGNFPEFQRIATLQSPAAITRQLARLDARFDAATQAPVSKPRVSSAPPPVRPVTGSASAVEADDDDLDLGDFIRKGNTRDHQRRRASR